MERHLNEDLEKVGVVRREDKQIAETMIDA